MTDEPVAGRTVGGSVFLRGCLPPWCGDRRLLVGLIFQPLEALRASFLSDVRVAGLGLGLVWPAENMFLGLAGSRLLLTHWDCVSSPGAGRAGFRRMVYHSLLLLGLVWAFWESFY